MRAFQGRPAFAAPAVLLLATCGGLSCAHAPDASAPATTVGTFNINLLNRDLTGVVATIEAVDLDVLVLQEVTPAAAAVLDRALADRYAHRSFQGEFALLSRLPVRFAHYVPGQFGRRGCLVSEVDVGGKRLQLAAVHLRPQRLTDATPAGVLRNLAEAEQAHTDELRDVVRRLDVDAARVILGDFNSMPGFASAKLLRKRGYADVGGARLVPDATWGGDIHGLPWALRIDYIYVAGPVVASDSGTHDQSASDHRLLWAKLHLASETL